MIDEGLFGRISEELGFDEPVELEDILIKFGKSKEDFIRAYTLRRMKEFDEVFAPKPKKKIVPKVRIKLKQFSVSVEGNWLSKYDYYWTLRNHDLVILGMAWKSEGLIVGGISSCVRSPGNFTCKVKLRIALKAVDEDDARKIFDSVWLPRLNDTKECSWIVSEVREI